MRGAGLIGIALILLGVISLLYEGIPYRTRENAVNFGPLQITTEKTREIPLPPLFGGIALAGGIYLLLRAKD